MNTRQQILDAAEQLIRTRGLSGATTKEIAKAAGYAEGTIYKHFSSKQELFIAVIQENVPAFAGVVQSLVEHAAEKTVQANLEAIALAILGYYDKIILLSAAFLTDPELLAEQRQWMRQSGRGPLNIHRRVEAYIKLEQEAGRISALADATSTAWLLLGPCLQYTFLRKLLGENPLPQSDQQFVTALVQTLSLGLDPDQKQTES